VIRLIRRIFKVFLKRAPPRSRSKSDDTKNARPRARIRGGSTRSYRCPRSAANRFAWLRSRSRKSGLEPPNPPRRVLLAGSFLTLPRSNFRTIASLKPYRARRQRPRPQSRWGCARSPDKSCGSASGRSPRRASSRRQWTARRFPRELRPRCNSMMRQQFHRPVPPRRQPRRPSAIAKLRLLRAWSAPPSPRNPVGVLAGRIRWRPCDLWSHRTPLRRNRPPPARGFRRLDNARSWAAMCSATTSNPEGAGSVGYWRALWDRGEPGFVSSDALGGAALASRHAATLVAIHTIAAAASADSAWDFITLCGRTTKYNRLPFRPCEPPPSRPPRRHRHGTQSYPAPRLVPAAYLVASQTPGVSALQFRRGAGWRQEKGSSGGTRTPGTTGWRQAQPQTQSSGRHTAQRRPGRRIGFARRCSSGHGPAGAAGRVMSSSTTAQATATEGSAARRRNS